MKNSVLKAFVTVASATLLCTAVFAGEDPSKTTAATFDSLDKNADQQISKSEAAADKAVADSFASMDANGDGYLSKSEYMAKTRSDHT